MRHEDVKIGMKVVPHDKTIGCSFEISDYSIKKREFLFVINERGYSWILSSCSDDTRGEYYHASDFEPYEEKTMTDLERVIELEKQLAELKASIAEKEKPKKDWPDSFEEAMELSSYWGMQNNIKDKYIIYPSMGVGSNLKGRAFSKEFGTWTSTREEMRKYWDGTKPGVTFKKFNTVEELWKWFAE